MTHAPFDPERYHSAAAHCELGRVPYASALIRRVESEVAIRTAYIDLEARPGDNHVPGTVRQRLFHGDFVQYVIDSAPGSLSVRRPPVNLLDEVWP